MDDGLWEGDPEPASASQPLLEPLDDDDRELLRPLDASEPKPGPTAERADKKNYAQRLSNALAQTIADALRPAHKSVTPDAAGRGQEASVGVAQGTKRLDVKVTDPTLGLLLSLSIKTYSFQDWDAKKGLGRYTKNIVRNDHELRGEASVLHQRQPYSVVIGVMFEPIETALDGKTGRSSFAHHVATLRKRAGRGRRRVHVSGAEGWMDVGGEDSRHDLCERVFIGLYETEGERRGHVRFVDVERPVPERGLPHATRTLSFSEFVDEVVEEVRKRNSSAPAWSDSDDDDPAE